MAGDRTSRPDAKPDRLFVAVEIPEDVARAVADAYAPWRDAFPAARWVPRQNWHVTLKFLGRTSHGLGPWVRARIAEAAGSFAPFPVSVDGVGSFPSPRRGRVLWAALADGGAMSDLADRIAGALSAEFRTEARSFHPHLTVARADPPLTLPDGYGATELETGPWTVKEVVLFRSHLRRPAPVYESVARFGLGTGTSGQDVSFRDAGV